MRQLVVYNGTVAPSDSGNTPNAVVERDANGAINVNAVNANGNLNAKAGLSLAGVAISASITADQTTTFYEVDASAAARVVTLPPVGTVPNQVYVLIKTDSGGNNAGFKGNGSETINGSNTANVNTQYAVLRVRANAAGTAWYLF